MRIKTARVRMFRNVVDSGVIEFQEDVTALVGKNESGKTALLEALHRLNPAASEAGFEALDDYPRYQYTRDRKAEVVASTVPIKVQFDLESEDIKAVEDALWPGVLTSSTFTFGVNYKNSYIAQVDVSEDAVLTALLKEFEVPEHLASEIHKAGSLDDVLTRCRELGDDEEFEGQQVATELSASLKKKLQGKSLWGATVAILQDRVPRFFYFSDYQTLPSEINLTALGKSDETPGSSPNQTARALLTLAGADTKAMTAADFEARRSELEAASNELTQQVFEYWTQNTNLAVVIEVEPVATADKSQVVHERLRVRVRDNRHNFTGSFGQRSKGFQWFFSFFAAFSEFEDLGHDVVVLLDEPAMSLHGKAQADFLRFINERLAAQTQVVYTTHSPFMVEPNRLERVRLVEDTGPVTGARVSSDVTSVGEDATFPLQAALGYDLAQNLLVGSNNLLLEGGSDDTYLRIMSDFLRRHDREGLDDAWRLISTHGATNMPAFVSLFSELDVTLLIDGTSKSVAKLDNLVQAKAISRKQVVNTDDFSGMNKSDIEDLFSPGEYLKFYNMAFNSDLKVSKLGGRDRIVARISRATGEHFKEHGKPAEALMRARNRESLLGALSPRTLDKWEKLFKAINASLE